MFFPDWSQTMTAFSTATTAGSPLSAHLCSGLLIELGERFSEFDCSLSLCSFTGARCALSSESSLCLTSLPFPLSTKAFSPNKYLACLIQFWHLFLEDPNLHTCSVLVSSCYMLLFHSKQLTNENKRKVIKTIRIKHIWRVTVFANYLWDYSWKICWEVITLVSCVFIHLISRDITLLHFSELHFRGWT